METLNRVRRQWTTLGSADPFRAILAYPDKQRPWDENEFFQTGLDEIETTLEIASQLLPITYNVALDFGCGVGRLSQAMARRFQNVIGIDVAESMIQRAEALNRFPANCRYVLNTKEDIGVVQNNSVDFIYSSITLQHLAPALASGYIREFFRVARIGAHVIFQLPCSPRSRSWQLLKDNVPVSLTNWIWRMRTGSPAAMESYFIPEREVLSLIGASYGRLLRIVEDNSGPPGWRSRKYYCTKA